MIWGRMLHGVRPFFSVSVENMGFLGQPLRENGPARRGERGRVLVLG
mgnify:CR=1 FL=1